MSTEWLAFWSNRILIAAALSWAIGQAIKVPIEYILHRRIDWSLLVSAGGMPSSHSALVTSTALAIGIRAGFDSPLFALACVVATVVIYDATGVRRHAGDHARILNLMMDELFTGHPLAEKELKEVLGHTPREVVGGVILGLLVALVLMSV